MRVLAPGDDGRGDDGLDALCVATRVDEHTEPPVAEAARAPERGGRSPPDHNGHRGVGNRANRRALQRKRVALMIDHLAGKEPPHERQRLVHARTAGGRIDAAVAHFSRIVAAGADPEDEPPRRQLGDGRNLTRDRNWVAQRKEVDRGLHVHSARQRGQRSRLEQAVIALAAPEAHVVTDPHAVEATRLDVGGEAREAIQPTTKCRVRNAHAHRDRWRHRLTSPPALQPPGRAVRGRRLAVPSAPARRRCRPLVRCARKSRC